MHPEYLRVPALEPHLTMVYVDPVGSGDSDPLPDGDYSMSRYARFTEAVLNDLGAPTAYFLGHSHGGFVALQFGIDHPERLDGLILYDTAPVYGPELMETATRRWPYSSAMRPDRPEAAEAGRVWDARMSGTLEITDSRARERYLEALLPAYFADHRATARRIGTAPALRATHDPNRLPADWDVRDRLGTIAARALVIVGSYDFICPPRFAYEIRTGIPDARLCELTASGHFDTSRRRTGSSPPCSTSSPPTTRGTTHEDHGTDRPGRRDRDQGLCRLRDRRTRGRARGTGHRRAGVRLGAGTGHSRGPEPLLQPGRGFGPAEPITADVVEEVCGFYRAQGVARGSFMIAPSLLPSDWTSTAGKWNLTEGARFVKLGCDVQTAVAAADGAAALDPDLRVGLVESHQAGEWATVMMATFGFTA